LEKKTFKAAEEISADLFESLVLFRCALVFIALLVFKDLNLSSSMGDRNFKTKFAMNARRLKEYKK
jgi:hypothetical protein